MPNYKLSEEQKIAFQNNPNVNPITKRKIKIGGPVHTKLLANFGIIKITRRRRSSQRSSQRSPRRELAAAAAKISSKRSSKISSKISSQRSSQRKKSTCLKPLDGFNLRNLSASSADDACEADYGYGHVAYRHMPKNGKHEVCCKKSILKKESIEQRERRHQRLIRRQFALILNQDKTQLKKIEKDAKQFVKIIKRENLSPGTDVIEYAKENISFKRLLFKVMKGFTHLINETFNMMIRTGNAIITNKTALLMIILFVGYRYVANDVTVHLNSLIDLIDSNADFVQQTGKAAPPIAAAFTKVKLAQVLANYANPIRGILGTMGQQIAGYLPSIGNIVAPVAENAIAVRLG
jgi:hypothetical protein